MKKNYGFLWVFIAVVGFSILPIFVTKAYSHGLETSSVTFGRFFGAMLLFKLHFMFRPQKIKIEKMEKWKVRGLSLLFACSAICYFLSLKYLSPVIFSFILYTYPLFTLLFGLLFFKERLEYYLLIISFVNFLGILLIVYDGGDSLIVHPLGVLFALLSAITFALFFVFQLILPTNRSRLVYSKIMIDTMTLLFAIWWIIAGMPNWTFDYVEGWVWVGLMSIISTYVAFTSLVIGISKLGSSKASLFSCQEPIWTVLFSFLILNESLVGRQWIGAALIFVSIMFLILKQQTNKQSSNTNVTPPSVYREGS
jgi:DME family drug/metabolite transporter